EGCVPEKTAWQIAREVAKGLGFAAARGVLHRDIKPENIFCTAGGEVKITEMGLSKSMSGDLQLTADGTTVGTPFFISPEQARGTKDLDARTDIYSLGCAVFNMLTGSIPFMGETLTEVMVKHTEAPRPDPRSLLPEISEGSAKLVMRMMAIAPAERPQSAAELIMEIEALLRALPEPEALVRPAQRILSSEAMTSAPEVAAAPPLPAPGSAAPTPPPHKRLWDWLLNLFD
ncbi:MAG: serine/threonine-protein kinase, partial [Planctomycetota bacterium]